MSKKKIEPTVAMILDAASTGTPSGTDARAILRAALNHPDAAGLFADEDDRPWEPLNGGPVRVGDEVRREVNGLTTTAVVGRVDEDGDPWVADRGFIGVLSVGTWYRRRPVRALPTEDGAVIIPADGHDYIEARVYSKTYRAREAVRHWTGGWHAAWRSGPEVRGVVGSAEITPGTWKVEGE